MTRTSVVVLCVLVALGCAPGPEHLEWNVGFETAALESESVAVSAWIVRGGCSGSQIVYEAIVGASVDERPSLRAGRYGVGATARAADCSVVAESCIDLRMPQEVDAPIQLTLTESRSAASCSASECVAGVCNPGPAVDQGMPDLGGGDVGTDCPGGTRRDGGRCYQLYATTASWDAARTTCMDGGGDLVVFDDAEEETWVVSNLAPTVDFWIGLTDAATEGVWTTPDGSAAPYEHWDPADTNGQATDCGHYGVSTDLWFYLQCNRSDIAVLCEQP